MIRPVPLFCAIVFFASPAFAVQEFYIGEPVVKNGMQIVF